MYLLESNGRNDIAVIVFDQVAPICKEYIQVRLYLFRKDVLLTVKEFKLEEVS